MNIESAETRPVTIAGLNLTIAAPFTADHLASASDLGDPEILASVMNQTYAENIRNNFAAKVTAAATQAARDAGLIGPEDELTSKTKAEALGLVDTAAIQADLDAYQAEYEFGVRRAGTGGGRPSDPVTVEAMAIARTKVKDALKKKGHKVSEVGAEKINELAASVIERHPEIMETARQVVESRNAVADIDSLTL